jgi:GT2 family glycosyltransferase
VSVASLAATAVIVRRAAFDAVEGFDESYFLYGEDLDLCHRLRDVGWTLLAIPQQFASHEGGGSASTHLARELTWWRGTMRYAALWWPPPEWGAALGAALLQWCALVARRPAVARRAWRELVWAPVRDRREVAHARRTGGCARQSRAGSVPPRDDGSDARSVRARRS